jgi:hypothetical protein
LALLGVVAIGVGVVVGALTVPAAELGVSLGTAAVAAPAVWYRERRRSAHAWARPVVDLCRSSYVRRRQPQTVAGHEDGHMFAIGHSSDASALMYPSYQGGMWTIGADDLAALRTLYPDAWGSPRTRRLPFANR